MQTRSARPSPESEGEPPDESYIPNPLRVLIAEDEPEVREILISVVDADPGLELAGVAADAEKAVEVARVTRPDVALLDVSMPGGGGVRGGLGRGWGESEGSAGDRLAIAADAHGGPLAARGSGHDRRHDSRRRDRLRGEGGEVRGDPRVSPLGRAGSRLLSPRRGPNARGGGSGRFVDRMARRRGGPQRRPATRSESMTTRVEAHLARGEWDRVPTLRR